MENNLKKENAMKKLKKIRLDEIKQYENNPRTHGEAIEAVVQSIKQCGYIAPIIVDEDGVILAGHSRFQALKRLGEAEVEVLIVDELTDEQKKKYRLLDNRVAEFSEWDFDKLETELSLIDFGDFNFDFDDFIFKPIKEEYTYKDDEADEVSQGKTEEKQKLEKKKMLVCPHCGELIDITKN